MSDLAAVLAQMQERHDRGGFAGTHADQGLLLAIAKAANNVVETQISAKAWLALKDALSALANRGMG